MELYKQLFKCAKNISSGKIFVILEKTGDKVKVLNPNGDIITVPDGLFQAAENIEFGKLESILSPKQIDFITKSISAPKGKSPKAGGSSTRSSSSRGTKTKKTSTKTGLGAQWESEKLTFYKHRIDPLGPEQFFKINLSDGNVFQIKKCDFLKNFSDVNLAPKYWQEGSYCYDEFPEKAKLFLTHL